MNEPRRAQIPLHPAQSLAQPSLRYPVPRRSQPALHFPLFRRRNGVSRPSDFDELAIDVEVDRRASDVSRALVNDGEVMEFAEGEGELGEDDGRFGKGGREGEVEFGSETEFEVTFASSVAAAEDDETLVAGRWRDVDAKPAEEGVAVSWWREGTTERAHGQARVAGEREIKVDEGGVARLANAAEAVEEPRSA